MDKGIFLDPSDLMHLPRLHLPNVGYLNSMSIGHNNMGPSPDWFLEMVEVLNEESGEITYFAANRWLADRPPAAMLEYTLMATHDDPRERFAEYTVCLARRLND